MFDFLKRYSPIIATIAFQIHSLSIYGAAVIGGQDNGFNDPYAATVSSSGVATEVTGTTPPGQIYSVAINRLGRFMIGGEHYGVPNGLPYGAFISPNGAVTPITGAMPTPNGYLYSVALNDSGAGIIGGQQNFSNDLYAAIVSPSGIASLITGVPVGNGAILSVAINRSSIGIIGGQDSAGNIYNAFVSSSGIASTFTGPIPAAGGDILSVGINDSGKGIIGGRQNGSADPYAAIVSPSGALTPVTGSFPAGNGNIWSVAINASGSGIIGGQDVANTYAALVSPSGVATSLTGLPGAGRILSVTINDSGAAIIGGVSGATPYAAIVYPSGVASSISGAIPTGNGLIYSVAISNSGIGIIGGQDNGNVPYAALISPSGVATSLTGAIPIGTGQINSVAIADEIDPISFGPGNTYVDPILALSTVVLEDHLRGIWHPTLCSDTPRYNLWVSPFGMYAHRSKEDSFPKMRDRSVGGMIGFDYLDWQDVVLGVGGAYAYQNVRYSENRGHAKVHNEYLTFYGAWHQKHISIQGALWGGVYQLDNKRKTLGIVTSTSHVDGWLFIPHLEIGVPFNPFHLNDKKVTFEPFVGSVE